MRKKDIDHWEEELFLSKKKSARIAWIVAGISLFTTFLMTITLFALVPLKEVKPIVITVDKHTGLANVESSLGRIELSDEEALTQSYLYQYVRDLETYDSSDQAERINSVFAKTEGQARAYMLDIFNSENELNPQKVFGTDGRRSVRVVSVVINTPSTAQVRYVVTEQLRYNSEPTDISYVSTLGFKFDRSETLTLSERWVNPVSFKITSYRRDKERL